MPRRKTVDGATNARILRAMADSIGRDASELNPTVKLVDLGLDSIDFVEMVVDMEDEFDVEIAEDAMDRLKTVGDVVQAVRKIISA